MMMMMMMMMMAHPIITTQPAERASRGVHHVVFFGLKQQKRRPRTRRHIRLLRGREEPEGALSSTSWGDWGMGVGCSAEAGRRTPLLPASAGGISRFKRIQQVPVWG